MCWKNYHTPHSVEEAVRWLEHYDGAARILGGGTDLLLDIQQGRSPVEEAMVDTSRIAGLDRISIEHDHIVIGCAVTHTQIVREDSIRQSGTCLVESCGVIGGPQVRNVATLAGNVAHAMPAGDGSIGLLALDGEIEVADANGCRWMSLRDAFLGPGKSVIDPRRALLTRLRFRPTAAGEGSAFTRIMRPQGVALPMISMAARLQLDDNKIITAVRISLGPAGPVPHLAVPAMNLLKGRPAVVQEFNKAADTVLASIPLRSSKHRATREYREEMIRTHLPMILTRAAERARGGQVVPQGLGL
ncbi:MAG: FAD binding domain-containing protein [Xanthomonadales bacterium]|nr:FAD binding domain-containing protein [Xanthomonadales bacterium]